MYLINIIFLYFICNQFLVSPLQLHYNCSRNNLKMAELWRFLEQQLTDDEVATLLRFLNKQLTQNDVITFIQHCRHAGVPANRIRNLHTPSFRACCCR